MRIFEGAGHGVFRDKPEEAIAVIREFVAAMSDLLEYRDRFPILEHTTYLINHSLGAMPAAVEERVREYARTWAERGIRAWGEGWWTMPLTVGDQIGRIVGAPPGTVCMHQNVSIAEAIVLSCFQPARRAQPDRLRARELPERALRVPGAAATSRSSRRTTSLARDRRADAARARAARAVQVGGDPGRRGDRPRARTPPVRTSSSTRTSRRARVPLDVTALDVDFAVGGSVKWLCGGPGAGWLYVRPDLIERLEPAVTGLAGARAAVRVRARARVRRRRSRASSPGRRTCRRSTPARPATT